MTMNARQVGHAVVLQMRGEIAGWQASRAIVHTVKDQARDGVRTIVVNLGGVPSIDLGGLGALLESLRTMRAVDGVLRLCGATRRIRDLIVITRLVTVFDSFDSVEDAIAGTAGISRTPAALPSAAALGAVTRFLRRA
jgi:anti-sigma B factor antagonist